MSQNNQKPIKLIEFTVIHEGRNVTFINKELHELLVKELRLSEARVSMLRRELEHMDARMKEVIGQQSGMP
jgi:hypothetical protein